MEDCNKVPDVAASAVLTKSEDLPQDTPSVKGYDWNQGIDYPKLLQSYLRSGFQATNFGLGVEEINRMIECRNIPLSEDKFDQYEEDEYIKRKSNCTIFLGFTSNMVSSGLRETIRFLVQHKLVDCIVTTAGGVEEDLIKCLAPTFVGDFNLKGKELRDKGINRIGNLLVPNDNYCKFEDWVTPLLNEMLDEQKNLKTLWTPSKMISRLGERINNEESVHYWAWKNKIPVFSPALTDGSLGDMMYFHSFKNPGLVVDILSDLRRLNTMAVKANNTGGPNIINFKTLNKIPVFSPALTDGSLGDMMYFHSFKNPGVVVDILSDLRRLNTMAVKANNTGGPNIINFKTLNKIPVFSPALTDGSLGDMMYFHSFKNPGLVVDILSDLRRLNTMAVKANNTGGPNIINFKTLNKIPVFSPALTDGSLGDMMYFHSFKNPGLVVDILSDLRRLNTMAVKANNTGGPNIINFKTLNKIPVFSPALTDGSLGDMMYFHSFKNPGVVVDILSDLRRLNTMAVKANNTGGPNIINFKTLNKIPVFSPALTDGSLGDMMYFHSFKNPGLVVDILSDLRRLNTMAVKASNTGGPNIINFKTLNKIPVFSPALTDGSLGDMMYFHSFKNPGLVVDILSDLRRLNTMAVKANNTGGPNIINFKTLNKIPVFSPALTDGSLGDMMYFHSFKNPGLVVDILSDLRRLNTMAVKASNTGGPNIINFKTLNKIPVFSPALTDGSLGDMMYFHSFKNPGLVVDILSDLRRLNTMAVKANNTGVIILGGGVIKHHICNANLMRNGTEYAIFLNTATEFDGSDSGARPDEAVSWGKIKKDAKPVKIYAEASLIFPLLVAETFAKHVYK